MTLQRKRGHTVTVFPAIAVVDARGHEVWAPDLARPITIRAAVRPDRSTGMEVPGQGQVRLAVMVCDLDAPVRKWARVRWDGTEWDVIAPPDPHYGPRATSHLTAKLRERNNR